MSRKEPTRKRRSARSAKTASEKRKRGTENPYFRERLLQLISDTSSGFRTRFAKRVGVGTSHVSGWCDDGVMPGGDLLHTIASKTGVSVDWLLGFDVPRYRGEDRARNELEADLAHFVARGVANGLNGGQGRYDATMIEVDAPRLLAECVAQGVEACANHRKAMLAYTVLAHSVTGASADLFVLGEALASTLAPELQVGLGNAVAEQRKVQEHASMQLAQLSAIINGNPSVRWSLSALWPELTKPTLHVLNWMAQTEPDDGRKFSTDPYLVATGQPTVLEMAEKMAAKGTLPR